jgi:hypothetical protein
MLPAPARPTHFPWQLDLRSVALFRILLALTVLLDLASRSARLDWWYSEAGIVPRALAEHFQGFAVQGLPALPLGTWGAGLTFALAAVFAVLLLVGYRSRLMAALLALAVLSLHTRNPLVLSGPDTLLQLALIWAALLPVGARFSLDARRAAARPMASTPPVLWSGCAALGLTLQIGYSYLYNAFYKSGPAWLEGRALVEVFSTGMTAREPGASLLMMLPEPLLRGMSWGVLGLEYAAFFLLLMPVPRIRLMTVFALMGMHLGLLFTMSIGLFPVACIAWLSALLPSRVWGRESPSVTAPGSSSALLPGRLSALVAGVVLVLVSDVNAREYFTGISAAYRTALTRVGLYQRWNKFAPQPRPFSGHYVVRAALADGREVDLFRSLVAGQGEQVVLTEQRDLNTLYGGAWWNWRSEEFRRYGINMVRTREPRYAEGLARFLCGRWNAHHPQSPVREAEVVYIVYERGTPPVSHSLWSGSCAPPPVATRP